MAETSLVDRFRRYHAHPAIIDVLMDERAACRRARKEGRLCDENGSGGVRWLVLPFHPAWSQFISTAFSSFGRGPWSEVLREAVVDASRTHNVGGVQLAWRFAFGSHAARLARLHDAVRRDMDVGFRSLVAGWGW